MIFKGKKASTPKDDACYALYNLVLGAESMGLSTCINQLAVVAYKSMKRKIRRILKLPKNAKIFACTSLGYPGYQYHRLVFRKPADLQII
jgi:nitroreductase